MRHYFFKNSFHNTTVKTTLRNNNDSGRLTVYQTKRVIKELCGVTDCKCFTSRHVEVQDEQGILHDWQWSQRLGEPILQIIE